MLIFTDMLIDLQPITNSTVECLEEMVSYTCNVTQRWEGFQEWALITPHHGKESLHFSEQSQVGYVLIGRRYPELSITLQRNEFYGGTWYVIISRADVRMTSRLHNSTLTCHYSSQTRFLFLSKDE